MTRAENKARRAKHLRETRALMTEPVAFARTSDAHRTDANPNRAKGTHLRLAPGHDGGRTKNDPRIELRTTFARIPSLGTIRTKNLPTWRS